MSGDHNQNQTDSGWRKRQIALNKKAENARELGLDYEPNKSVIELARDCGINFHQAKWPELERFAELVRADERNRTWTQDHWTEYEHSIAAAEREACAKVCEDSVEYAGDTLAAAIRARGRLRKINDKEALKLALEALTYIYTETTADEDELIDQAITAIKEALAQPEPRDIAALVQGMEVSIDVSTGEHDEGHRLFGTVTLVQQNQGSRHGLILLVQDPQPNFKAQRKPWVGLTDEEIQAVAKQARSKDHAVTLTGRLLKEKNT